MVDNGNKPRGVILILFALALTALIIYGAITLCLSEELVTWGYKDPVVSTTNIRGTIYDRSGRILAIQAPDYGFSVKVEKDKIQQISSFLSDYSDYDAIEIASLLERGETFIPLTSKITNPQSDLISLRIKEESLSPNIEFSEIETRHYPYNIASDILGYASIPTKGEGGIEELFNDYLKAMGEVGKTTVHGSSITLTLDSEIQAILEEVKKEMEIDEDAAIISNKGFIVAYDGKVDEEVLNNLVRFITPPSSVTTERALTLPSRMLDGISVGSYYLWSDTSQIPVLVEKIEKVMKNSGKI